jgi:tagaturonate reductase
MRPVLGRELVSSRAFRERADLSAPAAELLELPERVVQFGTGAFLRGFVEYFVDAANRAGHFDGRVVMVGSTGSGRDQLLNEQGGLYTLSTRGLSGGVASTEHRVIGSVSRALSARDDWGEVLACARTPELELVFSNTTEVGITLDEEDEAELGPPRSFPGKLTRFLYERAHAFDYDPARGPVVIPCELIAGNGDRLREIVLALAARWELDPRFARWVEAAVPFCNTLVDRIVPGTPRGEERERLLDELGYEDGLLTVCEVYRLFAIEADEALRARLRFAAADPGVLLTDDVTPYRERKVRILNGAHTILVPVSLLLGCETVRDAVEHPLAGPLLRRALFDEIVPSLETPGAAEFARDVVDRFANPFVRHALLDISLQGTMKMRVRVVPSIVSHARRTGGAPDSLAFGFAAYLLFLRGDVQERRRAAGLPVPADDQGERVRALWSAHAGEGEAGPAAVARAACSDESLWGVDLAAVPGFLEAVTGHLARMVARGPREALEAHLAASLPG